MEEKSKTRNSISSKYKGKNQNNKTKHTHSFPLPLLPFLNENYESALRRHHFKIFLLFKISQRKIECWGFFWFGVFFGGVQLKPSQLAPDTLKIRTRPVLSATSTCPIPIARKGMQQKRLEGCSHLKGDRLNEE